MLLVSLPGRAVHEEIAAHRIHRVAADSFEHSAIVERALGAELTHHLGYAKREEPPADQSNHRNGTSRKTALTDTGPLNLAIPRDREGSFEPQLIPKGERRFKGFDRRSSPCTRVG